MFLFAIVSTFMFWMQYMNEFSGPLLTAIAIVGAVMLCGGVLFVMLMRKMTGPLKLSVEQVEGMLSQSPSLDLDFIPAPLNPVPPELVNGLSNLGFQNWNIYFINQSKVLTTSIGVHANGALAVVYQHQFMGTWFEVYAQTQKQTYIWSSTPLFDENAVRKDVTITHHRLLTIHSPMEEIRNLDVIPILSNQAVDFLKNQHIKNEIHRLSIPLHPANIAPLVAQTGETDSTVVQTIYNNAQAARLLHLETIAWDAVGGPDASGETFVVHPYSVVSEDIHVLVEQLQQEKLWPYKWDEAAHHVPENFVKNVSEAIAKSLHYNVVKSVTEPLNVVRVERAL